MEFVRGLQGLEGQASRRRHHGGQLRWHPPRAWRADRQHLRAREAARQAGDDADLRAAAARISRAAAGSAGAAHGFSRALAGAGALGPALRVRAALRREAAAVDRRAIRRVADGRASAPRRWWSARTFASGAAARGSITLLRAAAEAGRFELELVPSVCIEDMRVSSSGVRAALAGGDFQPRARLVGARVFDARPRGRGRAAGPPARISDGEHPHAPPQAADDRHLRGARARRRGAASACGARRSGQPRVSGRRWTAPSRCSRRMCSISTAALYGTRARSGVRREDPRRGEVREPRRAGAADAPRRGRRRARCCEQVEQENAVADYKGTINLPETGFPMKADLAQREPKMLAAWEANDLYAKIRAIVAGPAALRAARRSAVRQRRGAPRPLRQQGAQGHRGQVAPARRLRLAVRARLGLPRPAHRTPGREEVRPRGQQAQREGIPRRLPQVRAGAGGAAARRLQALRRAGRLESPVPDHGPALRGAADPRAGQDHPQRTPI